MSRVTFFSLSLIPVLVAVSIATSAGPSRLSETYRETFARCSKTMANGTLRTHVRAIWQSFDFKATRDGFTQGLQVVTLNPVAIGDTVRHKGLTPRVAKMIHSEDFYLALNDCYGSNQSLKHTYVAGLIASDVSGKAAALGVAVSIGVVTTKVLGAATAAYPYLRYGIMAVGGGLSARSAYVAIREVLRDPTASERAHARQLIAAPVANSDAIVDETQLLLQNEIKSLKQKYNTADDSKKDSIRRRIILLTDHLDQLNALDNESNFVKG